MHMFLLHYVVRFGLYWVIYIAIEMILHLNKHICIFEALIPTSEYSTFEHAITIHQNHSIHLPAEIHSELDLPMYVHVESIKESITKIPFSTEGTINVKCSPRFSLRKLNTLYLFTVTHYINFISLY